MQIEESGSVDYVYLLILQYLTEHGTPDVKKNELMHYLESLGYSQQVCDHAAGQLSNGYLIFMNDREHLRLQPQGFFEYLNYVEMKESRLQAQEASRSAYWAIIIALLSVGIGIAIGVIQILLMLSSPN